MPVIRLESLVGMCEIPSLAQGHLANKIVPTVHKKSGTTPNLFLEIHLFAAENASEIVSPKAVYSVMLLLPHSNTLCAVGRHIQVGSPTHLLNLEPVL